MELNSGTAKVMPTAKGGNLPFEVKLLFGVCVLLSYPIAICLQLNSKFEIRHWYGSSWLLIPVLIMLWLVFCYFAFIKRLLRGVLAPVCMLVLPSAVLALTCQLQQMRMRTLATGLVSGDCSAFLGKTALEDAWNAAFVFYRSCCTDLAGLTGASLDATMRVQRIENCPGYTEIERIHHHDWRYLQYLEHVHRCGGWCYAGQPVWHNEEHMQDSCALSDGRSMHDSLLKMGNQVSVYSFVLMLGVSVGLLLFPGSVMPMDNSL